MHESVLILVFLLWTITAWGWWRSDLRKDALRKKLKRAEEDLEQLQEDYELLQSDAVEAIKDRNRACRRQDYLISGVAKFEEQRDRWKAMFFRQGEEHALAQIMMERNLAHGQEIIRSLVKRLNKQNPEKPFTLAEAVKQPVSSGYIESLKGAVQAEVKQTLKDLRDQTVLLQLESLAELVEEHQNPD